MSDFDRLRGALAGTRQDLDRLRQEQLLARESVRQSERALSQLHGAGRGHAAERDRLEKKLRGALAREGRAKEELAGRLAQERQVLEQFAAFTDPREGLGRWPDSHPILLFPLRLETRFKEGPQGQPQLWVRVYPDTCLVDAFEGSLTEQEVDNAVAFWAAVWRAGGDQTLERAAWRELVAAHGAGRAGYLVRQYLPLNLGDKPPKDADSDVLLIIPAGGPLPEAAATYWKAMWKANGSAAGQQAAAAALDLAVDADTAARIKELHRPVNFDEEPAPPLTRAGVVVKVAVLQLTPMESLDTRRTAWSSAPRVNLLPERLVLIGMSGGEVSLNVLGNLIPSHLLAGPDPNAAPDQQLKPVNDTLQIPTELAWMFDFPTAVQVGMAFRVDLTPAQAQAGFDRLEVLGVRLGDSPAEAAQHLERLLEHHLHSRPGLEILPQGRATNNTEKSPAGYSFRDDPESTFDVFFKQTPQYASEADPLLRRDGQWLADLLGLRHELVERVPNAGGRDQSDARAMQIALWPGTLGYMMKTLLAPVFSDGDVDATRAFFTRYVTGRGPLPALRIGAQPYGILPTTNFQRLGWLPSSERTSYLRRLTGVLKAIDEEWTGLTAALSRLGQTGTDPHQNLLDVLGLHPGSAEYYPLQADSAEHKFYEMSFLGWDTALAFYELFPQIIPLTLLRRFGYPGEDVPDLLKLVFRAQQKPLDGPLIDDRPLSESEAIRNYAGPRNYVEWLVDAARQGITTLQQEQGFDAGKKPAALLYLMLRHALQLGFYGTAVRLESSVSDAAVEKAAWREPAFVHLSQQADGSESRYDRLFRADSRITGQAAQPVGDFISQTLQGGDTELKEQIEALERLGRVPTARLERVFAEHVDCVSYRLDAWKTGLLTLELERRRSNQERTASSGLFLGAFGWVEELRPENKALTPVTLPDDLGTKINRPGDAPLMRDSTNGGLIHAPSLNHATTAAVLRNGYLGSGGQLAVNLSSRRVRLALGILEGMRNGQSLGALLGYQFERHVHDHGPLEVRAMIYPLRKAFPLVADQIAGTKTDGGDPQESIAAMNVVDGRKLVERAEKVQDFTYPFGVADLPRRDAAQEAALTNALAHIRDINDAVADLVLAEGVHQAVSGNYERSAGTLDAFAKGNYPPEPEVIRTPRSGIGLVLRTAVHLTASAPAGPLPTPLARAEPSLDAWLADHLPDPGVVGCGVGFVDRGTDAQRVEFITQQQLGLSPSDLLYRAEARPDQALGDLDDLILRYLHANFAPRHDRDIRIRHTERASNRVTWFELQALLRSLGVVVKGSRPLTPADLMRANDATREQQAAMLDRARIGTPRNDLNNVLIPALDAVAAALADTTVTIDDALVQFAGVMGRLAEYRLPQTGVGFVFEWRTGLFAAIQNRVAERLRVWAQRLTRFEQAVQAYDANTPGSEAARIAALQQAELIVRTSLTPAPGPSGAYRLSLNGVRAAYEAKAAALQDLIDAARPTLTALLQAAEAELPLSDFDPDPLSFNQEAGEIDRFRARLTDAVARVRKDVVARVARVDALLLRHDAAAPAGRPPLLQDAARILLGDDFQMFPRITLPAGARTQLANAWQYSDSGDLTRHLTDTVKRDFPVEDWLHGVARVREKMHHWETVLLLGEALTGRDVAELTPLQLPYEAGEPWLAMELPAGHEFTGERLLYTAHFADGAFDATQPVCGFLVDEWTEVIPSTTETTGIAFHYDRPNCEPPQAWLMAMSPVGEGAWSWNELVGVVNDTLDAAKRRAIEPAHLGSSPYSWFLPATMSAYTFPEISISNHLLRNKQIYSKLAEA